MTAGTRGVTRTHVGTTPDGHAVERWTLTRDHLRVEVLTHGARLHAVHVPDRDGHVADVVHGPADLAGHLADRSSYAGAVVGRWANRIGGARLRVDGVTHDLDPNEGTTSVHGGPTGFDVRPWTATATDGDDPGVRLALTSPDGDNGFPGELAVTATYRLPGAGVLALDLAATTDAATAVNLTTHTYWDLGPDTAVAAHRLRVPASRVVLVDPDDLLPRAVEPVDGTPYDLRGGVLLREVLEEVDLDNHYRLDGPTAAVLTHPRSGRRLTMTTDQPGAQVYLGGQQSPPHRSLAIEPGLAPDAPNRPDLDLGPSGVLHPGETYRHAIRMAFDVV